MAQSNGTQKGAGPNNKAAGTRAKAAAKKDPVKATATRKLATATKKAAATKTVVRRVKAAGITAKRPAKKVTTKRRKATATPAAKSTARRGKPANPAATVKRKQVAKRVKNVVLHVPAVVIDTTAAAAVAANLVLQHTRPAGVPSVPSHPVTPSGLKRSSSAFRHAKERTANPVARQLAHVFGPMPHVQGMLPTAFRSHRQANTRQVTNTLNPHTGHFGVPRRAAG